MFIKIKHIHVSKLIKLTDDFDYEDVVNKVKEKFPEFSEEDEIYFTDESGAFIEQDILVDYINTYAIGVSTNILLLIVVKARTLDDISTVSSNTSTLSIISTEEPNELLQDMVFETTVSPNFDVGLNETYEESDMNTNNVNNLSIFKKPIVYKQVLTVKEWKDFISNRTGNEIFQYYEKNGHISKTLRIKLVNTCTAYLIEKYGISVPEFARKSLAEAIIKIFPNLRNPFGPTGYEAFYKNDNGGEGYISYRIREVGKHSKNEEIGKLIHRRKRKPNTTPETSTELILKRKCVTPMTLTTDIEETIEFLKNACPNNDREAILEKMTKTYHYRKSLKDDILKIFPRFLDTPYLIEHDFKLKFPDYNSNFETKFLQDCDKILKIYATEVVKPSSDIILTSDEDISDKYDKPTRALLAVVRLLQARPKRGNNPSTAEERLIIFKRLNRPTTEIIEACGNTQPYLLAQGTNKAAITSYNIVINQQLLPCPSMCTAMKAFELLFMSYFTFNLRYDLKLKPFFEFFQSYYFNIDCQNILFSPCMILLRTRLQS